MDMRTVGIVGFGQIAQVYLEALEDCPHLRLIAVTDIQPRARKDVPPGVRFFEHSKDMYRECSLDSVIIATPHHTHCHEAIEALKAGVHVLIEKPMTRTREAFKELIETASDKQRLLVAALHASFGREIEWLLQNRHMIPTVAPLKGFCVHISDPYVRDGRHTERGNALGKPWQDSGVNALSVLDVILPLFSVRDFKLKDTAGVGLNYNMAALATYTFKNAKKEERIGEIRCTWMTGEDKKQTHLEFDDGYQIILDHNDETITSISPRGEEKAIANCKNGRHRLVNHYVRLLNDFSTKLQTRIDNLARAQWIHDHFFQFFEYTQRR